MADASAAKSLVAGERERSGVLEKARAAAVEVRRPACFALLLLRVLRPLACVRCLTVQACSPSLLPAALLLLLTCC